MPAPEVRVSISGDNSKLTAELQKSESSLGSFVSSAKGVLAGLAASAAAVALGEFFKSSLEEAGKAELGIKRLGVAVTNAGGDFRSLQPDIEKTITGFVRLTKYTDDDLRAALTNMVGLTSDTAGSLKNLSVVTDLAAFKQIPLEEAATAVGKAMNGNVTAFNKLGIAGKDGAVIIDQLRTQFAGYAANEAKTFEGSLARITNNWGEFKEAVGTAILSSGAMTDVTNLVVETLVKLQDWIVKNEDEIGALITTIAKAVIGFGQFLGKIVEFGQGADRVALRINAFLHSLHLVPLAAQSSFEKAQDVEADYQKATERMAREHTEGLAGIYGAAERKRTKDAADATEARKKLAKEEAIAKEDLVNYTNNLLTASQKELNKELANQKVNWDVIATALGEVHKQYVGILPLPAALNDQTETSKKHVQEMNAILEEQAGEWQKNVSGAVAVARGLLDGAHAMGVLSDAAANALGSVLTLADSVARIAGGDTIGGIVGIIGSLANILAGLGTSPQEKARLAAIGMNSQQIERLSREVGDLNSSLTGKEISGVQSALEAASAASEGKSGIVLRQNLLKELNARGLSTADLQRVAKDRGIDISSAAGLQQLLVALHNSEFSQFGQGFEGQLDFVKSSKDLLGLNENQQLQQFKDLASKFSPALAKALGNFDLNTPEGRAGATKALQGLFQQLNAGTLKPEDIGVSGQQFLALLQAILPLLSSATGLEGIPNLLPPTINPVGIGPSTVIGPSLSGSLSGLGISEQRSGDTTITGDTQIGPFYITPAEGTDPQVIADRVADTVAQVFGKRYIAQLTALGTPVGSVSGTA